MSSVEGRAAGFAIVGMLLVLFAGCAQKPPEPSATTSGSVPTTTSTISPLAKAGLPVPGVKVDTVAAGYDLLTQARSVPGANGILVVEKRGQAIWHPSTGADSVFLDLRSRVKVDAEQGLLSLAFPPSFPTDERVFVGYVSTDQRVVLSQFRASGGATPSADANTEQVLLALPKESTHHNGGYAAFGPDGFLYFGIGDDGFEGNPDPKANAQNPDVLAGKILRLDVSTPGRADAAAGNPFVGKDGRDEIWALGLRNPWRFAFDGAGGLFVTDVGEVLAEEVNYERLADGGGKNYGWAVWEGTSRRIAGDPDAVSPIHQYAHGDEGGCAITGGYVYDGAALPQLKGAFVYGDFCTGTIWALKQVEGEWRYGVLLESGLNISSFGLDTQGELLVVHHWGEIGRLAPAG
jgi:glucose/arabinose dehydrogenase